MKKYLWTQQSEEKAKRLGLEPRIAGTEATCGYYTLDKLGSICQAWLAQGAIIEAEQ